MAEKTTGVYRLVTVPALYDAFQNLLGGRRARLVYSREYFPDVAGKRLLEVGCGPGTWFPHLASAGEYVGVDWNPNHVARANEAYASDRVRFLCGDVAGDLGLPASHFDFVAAFGLLHHLDDAQAGRLLAAARRLLSPRGRFVAIEPVYHDGQGRFARWMKDRDSGQNIRNEEGYRSLLAGHFGAVDTEIRTGMLRIPYSHCVINAHGVVA